ncbi:hypothetical protein [Microtetraspora niveoalba]|uniref:hypothetical protein n=1 Tax=Microtetraspora niveoalba TaxID=46175 RepID=UPI000835C8E5|nr:hypothetical protein [Microtetraspora niveoalba]
MGAIPRFLLRHTAMVEPLIGEGPFGPAYGTPVEVRCFIDEKRSLVRDAEGSEVVSSTTVYMPIDTVCPVGSRVSANGRTSTVLTSSRRDGGGLPTPDHLEVALQ